jgi:3-mercaptopyruvate sulfurtransferase SseA
MRTGGGHIPGAVRLPVDVWIKEPEGRVPVMGTEKLADLMSGLGVSDDTTVTSYDDSVTAYATRLWWVLNYYGHANAKVLNGGWHRWVVEDRPITFHETEPETTSTCCRSQVAGFDGHGGRLQADLHTRHLDSFARAVAELREKLLRE